MLLEEDKVKPPCCDFVKEKWKMKKMLLTEEHWWLNPKIIENLPPGVKKGRQTTRKKFKHGVINKKTDGKTHGFYILLDHFG